MCIRDSGSPITTFAGLTDTNIAGLAQGNSLFYDGLSWVRTSSPIIWWDIGSDGSSHYTFAGPGFASATNDPDLYLYRGFTYAFDNSVNGGNHPFRIQSAQGLQGAPYTSGQTGSGSNILYFTVPMDAPNVLYYQCTIHALMNGVINIVS